MKHKKMSLLMLILSIVGYALLLSIGWKFALGVLLVHWSITIETVLKREDRLDNSNKPQIK